MEHPIELERQKSALNILLSEDEALRWSIVIGAYLDAEISLARAAAMLQLHPLELRQQLSVKGIPLHLGPENMADAQAEIDTIRSVLLAAEQRIQATGGIEHDDLWRQVDEDTR